MLNYPRAFFFFVLVVLWLSARVGAALHRRRPLKDDERADFGFVQTATLDAAQPHHRIQLLNGHGPLRSTQELRGSRD